MAKKKPKKEEKKEKEAAEGAEAAEAEGQPSGRKKKLIIGGVAGAILFQVVAVMVVRSMSGGPDEAQASPTTQPVDEKLLTTEVELVRLKATNEKGSRMQIYEVSVSVQVAEENVERLNTLIERRRGAINDAFNRVIRGADPKQMAEDTLEWLRSTLQRELERVLDEPGLVEALYIPRFMKYSAD